MLQPTKKLLLLLQPILLTSLLCTSTTLRGSHNHHHPHQNTTRNLMDGNEACSTCPTPTHSCIGRSVSDELCTPCSSGKTFWPCNVQNECWCWDTSTPKSPPGDEAGVCSGCVGVTESCIANANSLVPADDEGCAGCAVGQKYWPCDVEGLCWCWDNTKPKKPPAPSSGLPINNLEPCDIFTPQMYAEYAPNNTFPYTYDGFCEAIADYNLYHEEKVFMMGSEENIRNELAAFLGNTAHESDDFEAGREYLACADNIQVDGKTYCKPCTNDLFNWEEMKCTQSMADLNSPYSEYCMGVFVPPEGCECETVTQVEEEGVLKGYIDASKVFYGRGAIQLSWNYNYIKASLALTGSPETFCQDPELVVSDPKYAWGSAIYFWMESEKEGKTCHKEALKHNFGGTLNVINGGLECPAYAGGWHHKAVKMRINRYCHASLLLELTEIGSMSGCKKMDESLEECLEDGSCPYCEMLERGDVIDLSGVEVNDDDDTGGSDEAVDTVVEDDADDVINEDTGDEDEDENTKVDETTAEEFASEVTNSPITAEIDTAAPMDSASTSSPTLAGTTVTPTVSEVLTSQPFGNLTSDPTMSSSGAPSAFEANSTAGPTSNSPSVNNVTSSPSNAENSKRSLSSLPSGGTLSSSPTISASDLVSNNMTSVSSSTVVAETTISEANETAITTSTISGETLETTISVSTLQPTLIENETTVTTSTILAGTDTATVSASTTSAATAPPTPVTTEAENTVPTFSPTATETETPSYSPTTPQPTLGPCSGEACPDDLCRSPWGYCGEGEGYCNEDAIWSPDCLSLTDIMYYDPEPSNSEEPYDPESSETETTDPTKSPSLSNEIPKFVKPSGGKKPPPNKKPGSTSSGKGDAVASDTSNNEMEESSTNTPTPAPNTPAPTDTPVTESPTEKPVLSPDDPAATYFCGNDWIDANTVCEIRCPSAKSEDCPGDQSCYAFTKCNESNSPTLAPIEYVEPEIWEETDNSETAAIAVGTDNSENSVILPPSPASSNAASSSPVAGSVGASSTVTQAQEADDANCAGKPCEIAGECRSQFGFCGGSFIYCNTLSSWSIDKCGLFGTDENGETLLCGADIHDCPSGERMIRNPDNNCEFFPCPVVEEETDSSAGSFFVPASGPTLPELPKPTLPTITDPKKPDLDAIDLAFGSKPSGQTINLGAASKPDKDQVVVIGNKDDVEDDEDKASGSASSSTDNLDNLYSYGSNNFGSFDTEEWFSGAGRTSNGHLIKRPWHTFRSLIAVAFLII